MDCVRVLLSYDGQWEHTREIGYRYVGNPKSRGVTVGKNITFNQFFSRVEAIMEYDRSRYEMELKGMNVTQGVACRTEIQNDEDLQFILNDDRWSPHICVSFIERRVENDVPASDRRIPSPYPNNVRLRDSPRRPDFFQPGSCSNQGGNTSHPRRPNTFVRQSQPPVTENEFVRRADVPEFQTDNDNVLSDGSSSDDDGNEAEAGDWAEAGNEADPSDSRGGTCGRNQNFSTDETDLRDPDANPGEWSIPGAEAYQWEGEASSVVRRNPSTDAIYRGQIFPNKKDLQRIIGLYALSKNFECRVHRSTKSLYHAVCKAPECEWKCRAVRIKEGTFWEVRGFVDRHTCALEQIHRRHRQASASLIGEVVAPRLSGVTGRVMKPKDIIADMKEIYGIQILYTKAHKALQYALSLTYGFPGDSYQLLPSYCYVLQMFNPGTVTDILIDRDDRFLYHFMSFGPSIRGFLRHLRPIIAVDGTHLKGRYKGVMFVACAKDGNDQTYPLAFGYGDSENNHSWTWFFTSLKTAIGDVPNLMFISDRHASIGEGIRSVFPDAEHVFCCWHIGQNLVKQFHRTDIKTIFWAAAESYTVAEFDYHMAELRRIHPRCYDTLMDIHPRRWSRVHCPLPRYKLMTTNIAECVNSCLRYARQLPVTTLSEFIRNMVQRWHYDRLQKASSWSSRLAEIPKIALAEEDQRSYHMTAYPVDWNTFQIKQREDQWTVDLQQRTCTCEHFQRDLMPCAHAIAAARSSYYVLHFLNDIICSPSFFICYLLHICRERNLDVSMMCADFYTKDAVTGAYAERIMPVGGPKQWVVPDQIRNKVILPPISMPQTGRPRRSRMPSSAESVRRSKCRYCGTYTHRSRDCPCRISQSTSQTTHSEASTSHVMPRPRRKCAICHEPGHNKQTCPQRFEAVDDSVPEC